MKLDQLFIQAKKTKSKILAFSVGKDKSMISTIADKDIPAAIAEMAVFVATKYSEKGKSQKSKAAILETILLEVNIRAMREMQASLLPDDHDDKKIIKMAEELAEKSIKKINKEFPGSENN